MTRRRAMLRVGLAVLTGGVAGCSQVEEFVGNTTAPQSNGYRDTPRAEEAATETATATATETLPSGLRAVAATGANTSGRYVGTVTVTVEPAPGAGTVDLEDVRVTWLDPNGEYRLVANTVESSRAHGHFGIRPVDGPSTSLATVAEPGERFELVFDLGRDQTDADDPADDVSGLPWFGRRVEAGWAITLQFTTGQGRTSRTSLTVPEAVGGRRTVDLM